MQTRNFVASPAVSVGIRAMLPLLCALATGHVSLEGVANFRAVSPSLPGLYRAGALERATAADVAYLLDGARIRTIIDLRNDDEIDGAWRKSSDYGRALRGAYDGLAPVGPGRPASEGAGNLCRSHVPLLVDADAFLEEVAASLSPARKAEAAAYRMFDGKRYDRLLYDEVARGKQAGLYRVMLRTSAEIGPALKLVAERREHGPVLFHCAQGKDRTGVLAALLQHVGGDDEAQIVRGYEQSAELIREHEERAAEHGMAADEPEVKTVDWSALRGSPAEAMAETFAFLRSEHGSIDGYLATALGDASEAEAWRRKLLNAVRRRP